MRRSANFEVLAFLWHLASLSYQLSAAQSLLPNVSTGCPYLPEPCTEVALLPVPRNDSCHRQEANDLAQQVLAADAINVGLHALHD